MGANATKEFNKIFGAGSVPAAEGPGGRAAGTEPDDNPGSPGYEPRDGGGPKPPAVAPPTIPKYNAPNFYAPRQSQLQKATYDPASTSHNYLQRFGVPSHY